jgi:hypothetical protein
LPRDSTAAFLLLPQIPLSFFAKPAPSHTVLASLVTVFPPRKVLVRKAGSSHPGFLILTEFLSVPRRFQCLGPGVVLIIAQLYICLGVVTFGKSAVNAGQGR